MKKLLLFLILSSFAFMAYSQTGSEQATFQKSIPVSVSTTAVAANNTNIFSLDLGGSSPLGYRSATIQVTGTWVATGSFQASNDNFTTTDALSVYNPVTQAWVTSTTANGTFIIYTQGYRYIRFRTTAYTSGTINSTMYASIGAIVPPSFFITATLSGSLPAGTNNIGDVDVLTVPSDPFGTNADAASATGSISAKLRFIAATGIPITSLPTLANITTLGTITNVVHVDDNASSLSIDIGGTAPTLGATANVASISGLLATSPVGIYNATEPTITDTRFNNFQLDSKGRLRNVIMDAAGNTRGANVNASNELLVAVSSIPSHSVTNAGTFVVQENGSALTALQLIDDAVFIDNGAYTDNSSKLNAVGYYYDEVAGTALTENDIAAARINVNRALVGVLEDGSTRGRYATVTASNALKVDGSAVTQPVSIAATLATTVSSSTVPVNTMNSASANSGVNSAIAGLFDDVSPTSITENNFGFIRMSANHNIYNTIRDAAGNERGANVTASNELLVSVNNASLAVTQATSSNLKAQVDPLTATSWGVYIEDNGETAGGNLMMVGAVRRNAAASSSGSDGDNSTLNVGKTGALWDAQVAQHGGGADFKSGSIGATKTDIGTANTPTTLYGIDFYNANSSVAYVQFFNAQASAVTLGTTAPDYAVGIPATSGYTRIYLPGLHFSTALSIAITTTRTGSTAPSSTVDYNIDYKQ